MASRSNKTARYAQPAMTSAPKTPPKNSILGAVRSVVANRKPPATTGVARAVAQAATDRNGNRLGPRPTVGEADPATRRAALDAALRPGPPVKRAPPKRVQTPPPDASGAGGRARSKKIDDLVGGMQ